MDMSWGKFRQLLKSRATLFIFQCAEWWTKVERRRHLQKFYSLCQFHHAWLSFWAVWCRQVLHQQEGVDELDDEEVHPDAQHRVRELQHVVADQVHGAPGTPGAGLVTSTTLHNTHHWMDTRGICCHELFVKYMKPKWLVLNLFLRSSLIRYKMNNFESNNSFLYTWKLKTETFCIINNEWKLE